MSIPVDSEKVRIFPAGFNVCETYQLTRAIHAHYAECLLSVNASGTKSTIRGRDMTVEWLYARISDLENLGFVITASDKPFYLFYERDDTFAILAGSREFMDGASPFSDDIGVIILFR